MAPNTVGNVFWGDEEPNLAYKYQIKLEVPAGVE
jgi:hypothetical protein